MTAGNWDDNENDVIVASYFSMLHDELCGRPYNKAANNRELQEKTGRSRGSIEFKLSNVTAACVGLGLPTIQGYRPRFNFQMSLAESVARWIAQNPDWETAPNKQKSVGFADAGSLFVGVAPTLRNSPPPEEAEQIERIARRFDVAGRDDRNRALGHAGEEVVFYYERATLRQKGRDDLAKRVRWTSREDGDGAGYDISSFTPEGRIRLIEVKTTNGWERTPFYISRNELEVSKERCDDWCLLRLYEFARKPKAFELRAPLDAHVSLIATSYQANFQ